MIFLHFSNTVSTWESRLSKVCLMYSCEDKGGVWWDKRSLQQRSSQMGEEESRIGKPRDRNSFWDSKEDSRVSLTKQEFLKMTWTHWEMKTGKLELCQLNKKQLRWNKQNRGGLKALIVHSLGKVRDLLCLFVLVITVSSLFSSYQWSFSIL